MRGRKPKALTRQIVEGDPRKIGKRKLQQRSAAEPKAMHGLPACPRHLRGRARAAWNFWREELRVMELNSRPDAMMLEGACVNYAKAVQADALVLAGGVTVEEPILDSEGQQVGVKIKRNPADVVSNRAWALLKSFCSEFGLSPVSRTRLAVEKPNDEDQDLMDMLSRPRAARARPVQ
jgi:P27 family predicted phage terminase small subunit